MVQRADLATDEAESLATAESENLASAGSENVADSWYVAVTKMTMKSCRYDLSKRLLVRTDFVLLVFDISYHRSWRDCE